MDIISRLEEMGASVVKLPNTNKDTYLLDHIDYQILGEVAGWSDLADEFRPPAGYIGIQNIPHYGFIGILITMACRLTRIAAPKPRGLEDDSVDIEFDVASHGRVNRTGKFKEVTTTDNDMEMEEGELEGDHIWWHCAMGTQEPTIRIKKTEGGIHAPVFMKTDDLRRLTGAGFIAPFEQNLAAPDHSGLISFLRSFSNLGFDDEDDEVQRLDNLVLAWVQDISISRVGDWMAHMMRSVTLAKEITGSCVFVVNEVQEYLGAVIMCGEGQMVVVNGKVSVPVQGADLTKELALFSSHEATLEQIRGICGLSSMEGVSTMRKLSNMLMAQGLPSGSVVTTVTPLLSKLRFSERPEPVNVTSLCQMLRLLASSDADIPDTLFLHRTSVFSTSRTERVISMFGDNPPTFNFGGPNAINASPIPARGVPVEKVYSPTPPRVFQSKRISLVSSVQQYNAMLQNGLLSTNPDRPVPGSRVYSPQESLTIWAELGRTLVNTVVRKGGDGGVPVVGVVRQREPDSDAGRKKRVKSYI